MRASVAFGCRLRCLLREDALPPSVIHAERNAISSGEWNIRRSTLYTTRYPCVDCAWLIAEKRIRRVVYIEESWYDSGEEILEAAGIPLIQIPWHLIEMCNGGRNRPGSVMW